MTKHLPGTATFYILYPKDNVLTENFLFNPNVLRFK